MSIPPPPIPAEVLFRSPERALPRLSPDGSSLAFLTRADGKWNIWNGPAGGPAEPVTESRERDIVRFRWAHDGLRILYESDARGDENWHVFSVDTKTGNTVDLTPFGDVYAQIIASSKSRPTEVLVAINLQDRKLHDVYRVDISTGAMELEARNPGQVSAMQPDKPAWFADAGLRIRACVSARDDGSYDLMVKKDENRWARLLTWEFEDSRTSRPLAIHPRGHSIYLIDSRDHNTGRVVEIDLQSGERTILAEDPEYDAAEVLFDPETGLPLAAAFQRERTEWFALQPEVEEDLGLLDDATQGDFSIFPASSQYWVVDYLRDDDAGGYLAFDRRARTITPLFEYRPDLKSYSFAKMEPIAFHASDGLNIHGYLSFPPKSPRTNLPMVLFPHGGPWARDAWGFREDVQFLTTRGYLVMNVNFRGSTGYGKTFVNAGNREWAGKMHQDLIDGVQWAIEQGYADPQRVAIFGGSYGGYAALVGATFTPDVFRCIVDLFGWPDLVTAMQTLPPYWKPREAQWFRRVGDPYKEPEFLWSRSPLSRIDQISRPILIAHGTNDVRVLKSASDRIVAALTKKGIPHEYLVFQNEGHGFRHPDNRIRFYRAVERFLATHLGGRTQDD